MEFFFVKKSFLASVFATLVFTSVAQLLPIDEVQVLQTISSKLQNSYWNLNRSSCTSGFNRTIWEGKVYSGVACDCSFNRNTVCHVTNIQMKGLNLTGHLPVEFVNLSHLREIDLTRNYLNGSIPTSFGQLRLVILSLRGNRISGTIPEEIGNIGTLEELVLEDNLLEGNLPENLGSLSNLRRLLLSGNNFNGTIPVEYGNLRNLTDFRIDGSNISGKIPDFIGNWTNLERLDMQGTSLEGPIPDTISQLQNLRELRISDLNGPSMSFPSLEDMRAMKVLILRRCSINGPIPPYIGNLTSLTTLDLSFNMLSTEIPASLQRLGRLNYLFLSNNYLTGEVPVWILDSGKNTDLSYNNFIKSRESGCQFSKINLVASLSTVRNSISWCLKPNLPCPRNPTYHSLFINCGGGRISFEGNEYEDNLSVEGPSHFESHDRWAYSSTGIYMDNERGKYIATNDSSMISTDAEFYQTARLSPSSLKFYGLCLCKGSYRVRLHFAEIMYSDNSTFSILGRRIFDVAIQ